MVVLKMADNVFWLGEVGEFKVQMFKLVQKFNRIPMLKFSTKAPILPNQCYAVGFLFCPIESNYSIILFCCLTVILVSVNWFP